MAEDPLQTLQRVVREERLGLVGLARREGLSAEDALDCVHDAFCTFLARAQKNDLPAERPAAFLAGIVINTARNKRRRHHVARPHEILPDAPADRALADALLVHAEECVKLRACVGRLCDKQRTVVMMRLLEDQPGEDVAAALGLTRAHVDVLLHRAKAALRVCMAHDAP